MKTAAIGLLASALLVAACVAGVRVALSQLDHIEIKQLTTH